jgi:hypothetical protein
MEFFLAVVIVLVVLIYFMVVVLRSVITEVNQKVNTYFLKHLEEYDEQFAEKLSRMKEMNAKEEKMSRTLRSLEREMESYRVSPFYAPRPVARDIYIPTARYIDNDFFVEYKIAKDKLMSIDKQQVIYNVIDKVPYTGNIERYKLACDIISELNFEVLYNLCSVSIDMQLEILKYALVGEKRKVLEEFLDALEEFEAFDCMKFLDYVKNIRLTEDPNVYVSVAENEQDYTEEAKNIICSVDSNICEGIKIIFQNKIYDYSIYKTRRKG